MSKERKYYVTLSTLVALFALATVGFGGFAFLTLSQKQASIAENRYYTEKLNEKQKILSALEKRYEAVETDLPLIDNALPNEKDSSRLLADLDSLASSSNLKMTFLEPGSVGNSKQKPATDLSLLQTTKGSFGYEIPLELRVEGSYRNFLLLIEKMENYQRLINIESIDITKQETPGIPDYIQASINIRAYLKK
jgi:Tfp pilus assembly protein PilO